LSIRARPAARVMPLLRRGRPRSHPVAAPRLRPANVPRVHLPVFFQAASVRETSCPLNNREISAGSARATFAPGTPLRRAP